MGLFSNIKIIQGIMLKGASEGFTVYRSVGMAVVYEAT